MDNTIDVLSFRSGDFAFSFNLEQVKEIVHMTELYTPPGLPLFIEGFLNLEGTAVPVVSLSQLFFSTPARKHPYTPLILLKSSPLSPQPWAVLVDSVMGISPAEKTLPVKEEHIFTHCVTAALEIHQQKIFLLDPYRLLLEQEEKRLLEFSQKAQKRIQESQTTDRLNEQPGLPNGKTGTKTKKNTNE